MNIKVLLGKAAPTLLAFAGVGFGALCVYETYKVTKKQVTEEINSKTIEETNPEKPSNMDIFKKTVSTYKVPIAFGAAGVSCVLVSNHMHNEKIGELVGALIASTNIANISQEKIKILQNKLTEEVTKNVTESGGDIGLALKTTKEDIEKELSTKFSSMQAKNSKPKQSNAISKMIPDPNYSSKVFAPGPDQFVINITGRSFSANIDDVRKKIHEIQDSYINSDGIIGFGDIYHELGVASENSYIEDNYGYNHDIYMADYHEGLTKDPGESDESFKKRVEVTRQDNIHAEAEDFISIREFTDFGGDIVPHKYFIWLDTDYIYDDYMNF